MSFWGLFYLKSDYSARPSQHHCDTSDFFEPIQNHNQSSIKWVDDASSSLPRILPTTSNSPPLHLWAKTNQTEYRSRQRLRRIPVKCANIFYTMPNMIPWTEIPPPTKNIANVPAIDGNFINFRSSSNIQLPYFEATFLLHQMQSSHSFRQQSQQLSQNPYRPSHQ